MHGLERSPSATSRLRPSDAPNLVVVRDNWENFVAHEVPVTRVPLADREFWRPVLSWLVGAALLGIVCWFVAGVVSSAYEQIGRQRPFDEPPFITADPGPLKDVPGGARRESRENQQALTSQWPPRPAFKPTEVTTLTPPKPVFKPSMSSGVAASSAPGIGATIDQVQITELPPASVDDANGQRR